VGRGRENRTFGFVAQSLVQMPRYTVFGRVESESSTQQNACRTGIYAVERRENCTEDLQNQTFSSKYGLPVNNTVKKEELNWKS
jgi:hypothetical protein